MRGTKLRLPGLWLGACALALLGACGSADDGGGNGGEGGLPPGVDPQEVKPAALTVMGLNEETAFTFMDAPLVEAEWDVEIDYATADRQGVFDYYDGALAGLGFVRTDLESDDDEFEAEYVRSADGLEIDLEVDDDDGRTQVDLDADDLEAPSREAFDLRTFAGVDIPFFGGAEVVDIEYDFNFDHAAVSLEDAYGYYDGLLGELGWERVFERREGDEIDAFYRQEGVLLELELEEDDDAEIEIDIELNKLRFYLD